MFQQQGLGDWLEFSEGWMTPNTESPLQKTSSRHHATWDRWWFTFQPRQSWSSFITSVWLSLSGCWAKAETETGLKMGVRRHYLFSISGKMGKNSRCAQLVETYPRIFKAAIVAKGVFIGLLNYRSEYFCKWEFSAAGTCHLDKDLLTNIMWHKWAAEEGYLCYSSGLALDFHGWTLNVFFLTFEWSKRAE